MAPTNRSSSLITSRRVAVLLATTVLAASPVAAATYNVTDEASLVAAINAANASAGADTIALSNAITLTGALPSITDITTVNTGAFMLTGVAGTLVRFTGSGNVTLIGGGALTGSTNAIIFSGTGASTVDNGAGGTINGSGGAVLSTGTGTTTVTNGGDIVNGIVSTGGGNLIIDNAASGNIVRTASGSAIDMSNGGRVTLTNAGDVVGTNWGVVGRNAGDSIVNSGRIATGSISGNVITIGGNNAVEFQQGGSVTNLAGGTIAGRLAGITGGAVVVDNRAGASISGINGVALGGAAQVTNAGAITGGTGQFERGVNFTGSGTTLNNLAGGTIIGGRGVQASGTATIINAGTITSNCASPSFQCTAIILFNGGTVTNGATGLITSSSRGIGGQGSVATNIINDGSIVSTLANDNAVILFAGGSITNNANASIANANGYGAYVYLSSATITNAGSISGQFGASVEATSAMINNSGTISGTNTGVSGFNATLGLTNSGQVGGTQFAVRSTSGALSVTNLNGGSISSTNGAGVYTEAGTLSVDNQAGASIDAGGHAIRSAGPATITNAGAISSTNADAIWSGGTLTLTNSGTISGGFAGISATAGGSIVNSGTINGSANASGYSFAVQLIGSGSIINQSGGTLGGADGGIALFGNGAIAVDLQEGSTTGAIASTGDGTRSLIVNGALDGSYGSIGSGVDTLTLGQSGSMTSASLGGGDDLFTTQGGAIGGALDGGDGSDRFTANLATGVSTSFDLAGLTAFETIEKLGLGTLTLTGASASPDALILAGDGGDDDGLLIFDGTTGLTGAITVNGAIIRANSAGAFGTGTITMIDPTIQYAATGSYANNIVLAVPGDASLDPNRLEALNSATATLTGSITQDPMVGDQYVTIGGNGTIVLTNTANAWTGVTTIDAGATLQGASDTISGGLIVANGALNYVQAYSGIVAQDISGSGRVGVSGLADGETLTFAGNLTNNGINLTDGSSIALGGTVNVTSGNAVLITGVGATVTVLDNASVTTSNGAAIFAQVNAATVNNFGTIASVNDIGVNLAGGGLLNNGSASDSAASITGGFIGVASGNALLTVDNYGLIRGTALDGINSPIINLTNRSTGQIIADGTIGAGTGTGVAGTTVTVDNAGQIVGRLAGVSANGTIDLTNSGLIGSGSLAGTTFSYSDGNDGIQAVGGGTIDNLAGGQILGSISGIYTAGAALSVANAGLINGANANGNGGFGIYANGAGLTLDNLAGGTVNGVTNGIADLTGSGLAITNAGTISGDTAIFNQTNGATIDNLAGGQLTGVSQAIVANAAFTLTNDGSVTANNIAIRTSGGGTIINRLGGTISGGTAAFQSNGIAASAITNSGDITGGVVSTGGGNLSIDNRASGNIVRVVFGSAIDMSNGGRLTLTNAGDIVGSGWGVVGRNAGDSIINSGRIASGTISGNTITVSGNDAVQLSLGGSVTNLTGGQITGRNTGISGGTIVVDNRSGALISGINAVLINNGGQVTNAGTITGGTANGNSGVTLNTNGTLTNLAGGTITGARATQFSSTNASLNNSGTITSTAATPAQGFGALFFNGGTVTNQVGGLIDGQYRGVHITGGLGTVTNAGTIRATIDNAVSLFSGGTVTNQFGGTLTALGSNAWGIYGTGGALNLTNAGAINADTGIVTNANGAIVTNSGTITGTVDGVSNLAATTLTLNNNGGTITATNRTGVRAEGALILTNSGTIRSNATGLFDGATVFNGAAATITNSGTISAASASGVAVTGMSTITNSGTLTGGSNATFGYGVQFAAGSSGSLVNQSGGTIGGGAGSVLVATDNAVSIDLQAGSIANGAILSTGVGARTVNVAGALNGVYNASAGTGVDTVALASTGSLGGVLLGAGNDSFTTRGGAITGAVNSGAGADVLTFDIAGAASYNAGLFDGFETRSKIGAGTLTLTGTDAMTIDFALNGGTLVLSGGSALNDSAALITAAGTTARLVDASEQVRTISGAGAIDLGANALILGGNDSSTYSGVISGSGSLAKFGSGILTLSGANSYTGLTQISGGTLRLGASNVIANASTVLVASGATFDLAGFNETIGGLTGAGLVTLGAGRLTVDQSANSLFSGVITGTGGLTKAGVGTLDLTGASTYTGATFVDGGTLAVNGSLVSAVTVNAGGKLGGNGSVGNLSILSGGILAPGNSIGLLTVNGNLSFAPGSIYQVETTPTAADRTNVTGNITISGGTVQVLATGTAYNPLIRYTILDAGGAVSGTFSAITSNLAFLTPGLEYNPRSVVLVLRRNNINFTDVADTPNQAAVAAAVQSIGISPLYDAVLVQSADGARAAYDALSGEVYASTATAILAKGDRLQDAMASNQLRSGGLGLWLDAGRSWGSFDHSPGRGSAQASTDTNDLFGGLNWRRGPIAATLGGGRVIDKIEIDARLSDAKVKSWLFGGQLAYGNDLGLRAVAGGHYAWHKVATDRSILFPGFAETASSNRDGRGYHLFGQLSYASRMSGITIEPFIGFQRDQVKLDSTSETGGLAALDVRSASHRLTTAQLGFKLATTADLGWARLTPRASVAWQHVMGDRIGQMDAGFQAGGLDYSIGGIALARNAAKVGVDMDLDFGGATVVAGYNGTIGGVAAEHTAKVALQVRF